MRNARKRAGAAAMLALATGIFGWTQSAEEAKGVDGCTYVAWDADGQTSTTVLAPPNGTCTEAECDDGVSLGTPVSTGSVAVDAFVCVTD